ncbi:hypothetical protein [Rhodopila sp.]|uniref:hypothetical protein n=1 Tax=Rhodopila sp. TaxID=2480087 RepID=UPI003D0F533C
MLKAEAWPLSRDVLHWQSEARVFRAQAINRYTPSMHQRIDLARIYRQALRVTPETIDCQPPLPVADDCPMMLDDPLGDGP